MSPLNSHCAGRTATVTARERQRVALLLKALEDVLPLGDLMGDRSSSLGPMNCDGVTWSQIRSSGNALLHSHFSHWRGGRVVEGAALEMLYRGNSIEGSNPSLSVSETPPLAMQGVFFGDH